MAEPHSFRSNGQETIEVEEDGHLRSVTINGREHLKLYLIIKGNQVS
uniref:Uncharacterized protein n=1 Tax=Anas zonorhyncha TaxID=75864 RepID=A0A8B9V913_9AVES